MKHYIRPATVDEVLAALQDRDEPLDPGTANVATRFKDDWHLWEFDAQEAGNGSLTINGGIPLHVRHPAYVQELHAGNAESVKHLATHVFFLKKLLAGEDIGHAVFLNENYPCDIANGGHRSLAFYEFTRSNSGSVRLTVSADEPGSDSNAQTGQINQLATPLLGVTCVNDDPLFGNDEESDAALVIRARESLAKASPNGPRDAYAYFAKTATKTDGSSVGVTRVVVIQGNGTNLVYVASADGTVDGNTTDPLNNTTDLGRVNKAIQESCVPTGITAVVESAVPVNTLVRANVFLAYTSSLTFDQAKTKVLERLQTYFETIPIGGFSVPTESNRIFLEALIGQIYDSAPGEIVQVSLTLPASDVILATNQVAILTTLVTDITVERALPNG